jgi:peroxiredoxin
MPRVQVDAPAPEFALEDFRGREVRPADFASKNHVVLVFNRGFT